MKGLQFSAVVKGKIHYLHLSLMSLSFSQVITPLREFFSVHLVLNIICDFDRDDEVALQQLIAPGSGLRRLDFVLHSNISLAIFFQPSSLQELRLKYESKVQIVCHESLPHVNTNLKKLDISSNLLHPLAALIMNITSLTYLKINNHFREEIDLPVLTNIVQSHHTLEVLQIGILQYNEDQTTNLLQLIEAAGNSRLKKLRLYDYNYNLLPPHIHEQYKHLLEPQPHVGFY